MCQHGQHLAPAANGVASAVGPMQIGVQQGPESIPVTREDRFVSPLADVVHLGIMVRGGARVQTIPKGSWKSGHAALSVTSGWSSPRSRMLERDLRRAGAADSDAADEPCHTGSGG